MKVLHLEIKDICEGCPYLLFDNEWGSYSCNLANKNFTFDFTEVKYEWEIEIPSWCPLPSDCV